MSEREMLERAAAAAGICGEYGSLFGDEGICVMRAPGSRIWTGKVWNPLYDDGDALRLAVTLGQKYACCVFGLFNRAAFPHASASVVHRDGSETYIEQDADTDLGAATRLAITRAAAALAPTAQGE